MYIDINAMGTDSSISSVVELEKMIVKGDMSSPEIEMCRKVQKLLLDHVCDMEGKAGDLVGEIPESDYSGAAQLMGLEETQRMNLLYRPKVGEENDILFDDEPGYYGSPLDWDKVAELVSIQLKMEAVMSSIQLCNPAEKRESARQALDDHCKAYKAWVAQGKFTEHQEVLKELKARNTRAREFAMRAGLTLKPLWETWKQLAAEGKKVVNNDNRIWGAFFGIALSISRDKPSNPSLAIRRQGWMKDFLVAQEEISEAEGKEDIHPYFISRSDENDRLLDDALYASSILDRGEGLRDSHFEEVFQMESEDGEMSDLEFYRPSTKETEQMWFDSHIQTQLTQRTLEKVIKSFPNRTLKVRQLSRLITDVTSGRRVL